jgi:competence/damage-inducible protein CinA-like protein
MNAAIVTIGDEILIGQIVDTNSAWIAENLSLLGINITEIRSIPDKREQIIKTLKEFNDRVDLVIMSGGLGPTSDDITKESLNEYFGGKMEENSEVLKHIIDLFKKRGFELSEINRLQALIPDNCSVLRNPSGTAPGMWFEKNNTIFVSLPGVPFELKDIFMLDLIHRLAERNNGSFIYYRTIMTQGLPESYLAAKIKDWEEALPANVKLAYLPRPGIVRLRLTSIGNSKSELELLLQLEIDKLQKIIPKHIFSLKDEPLEEVVGRLLKEAGTTLCTAESCTGGRIASLITSVPGSSAYFRGAIVAYHNEIKMDELGIDESILRKEGAVSEKVVEQMAEAVRKKFNCEYGIGVSGVAGPSGGSLEKPVGTTWIAVSSPKKTVSKMFTLGEHRGRNIERASISALNMLRIMLLED